MQIDHSVPVFVVDDEFVMLTLVKKLVSNIGFEHVDHAPDGQTALSMLHERKYQLVISDLPTTTPTRIVDRVAYIELEIR